MKTEFGLNLFFLINFFMNIFNYVFNEQYYPLFISTLHFNYGTIHNLKFDNDKIISFDFIQFASNSKLKHYEFEYDENKCYVKNEDDIFQINKIKEHTYTFNRYKIKYKNNRIIVKTQSNKTKIYEIKNNRLFKFSHYSEDNYLLYSVQFIFHNDNQIIKLHNNDLIGVYYFNEYNKIIMYKDKYDSYYYEYDDNQNLTKMIFENQGKEQFLIWNK